LFSSFHKCQQWWIKIRSTAYNKTKIINNFKLNNFEQCKKLTKQKGKTYTIREALACGKAEMDSSILDEQLHIMEQVHATIIMILLLRDLRNRKIKNRVRKNCWYFYFKNLATKDNHTFATMYPICWIANFISCESCKLVEAFQILTFRRHVWIWCSTCLWPPSKESRCKMHDVCILSSCLRFLRCGMMTTLQCLLWLTRIMM